MHLWHEFHGCPLHRFEEIEISQVFFFRNLKIVTCRGAPPQKKTTREIQKNSETLNRAFELQQELKLHQNNLFFRFEISLRKSDALIL